MADRAPTITSLHDLNDDCIRSVAAAIPYPWRFNLALSSKACAAALQAPLGAQARHVTIGSATLAALDPAALLDPNPRPRSQTQAGTAAWEAVVATTAPGVESVAITVGGARGSATRLHRLLSRVLSGAGAPASLRALDLRTAPDALNHDIGPGLDVLFRQGGALASLRLHLAGKEGVHNAHERENEELRAELCASGQDFAGSDYDSDYYDSVMDFDYDPPSAEERAENAAAAAEEAAAAAAGGVAVGIRLWQADLPGAAELLGYSDDPPGLRALILGPIADLSMDKALFKSILPALTGLEELELDGEHFRLTPGVGGSGCLKASHAALTRLTRLAFTGMAGMSAWHLFPYLGRMHTLTDLTLPPLTSAWTAKRRSLADRRVSPLHLTRLTALTSLTFRLCNPAVVEGGTASRAHQPTPKSLSDWKGWDNLHGAVPALARMTHLRRLECSLPPGVGLAARPAQPAAITLGPGYAGLESLTLTGTHLGAIAFRGGPACLPALTTLDLSSQHCARLPDLAGAAPRLRILKVGFPAWGDEPPADKYRRGLDVTGLAISAWPATLAEVYLANARLTLEGAAIPDLEGPAAAGGEALAAALAARVAANLGRGDGGGGGAAVVVACLSNVATADPALMSLFGGGGGGGGAGGAGGRAVRPFRVVGEALILEGEGEAEAAAAVAMAVE